MESVILSGGRWALELGCLTHTLDKRSLLNYTVADRNFMCVSNVPHKPASPIWVNHGD